MPGDTGFDSGGTTSRTRPGMGGQPGFKFGQYGRGARGAGPSGNTSQGIACTAGVVMITEYIV